MNDGRDRLMNRRLYIFDIDDTLLIDNKLSDHTIMALDIIREKGHKIAINTGRMRSIVDQKILDYCDYSICANGATFHEGNKIVDQVIIEDEISKELLELTQDLDVAVAFRNDSGYHIPYNLQLALIFEKRYNEEFLERVFRSVDVNGSYNYFVYTADNMIPEVLSNFTQKHGLIVSPSLDAAFDIFNPKMIKGDRLDELRRKLPGYEFIGFGNSENDMSFLVKCNQAYYLSNCDGDNDFITYIPQNDHSILDVIKSIEVVS